MHDVEVPNRRVMHVIDGLSAGGAERMAVDLSNLISADRYDVDLVATRTGGELEAMVSADVRLLTLHRRGRWDLLRLRPLVQSVRSGRVDLIHSHGRSSMELVAFLQGLGLVRCPHVFHDHFGEVHINPGWRLDMRVAVTLGVDAFIGVDSWLCNAAEEFLRLDSSEIHLFRNGVDVPALQPEAAAAARGELAIPDGHLMLAMVANFRPVKSHEVALRALAKCRHRDRLHLVFIGGFVDEDYTAACRALVEQLGLGDHVRFLGTRLDVVPLLQAADIGVLSSKSESGPLAVLEYMAAEIPFVVTDTGELVEAVRDREVGCVVPVGSSQDMAAAIDALVDGGPEERRRLGRAGRQLAMAEFEQSAVAHRIEDLYDSVLNEHRRVRYPVLHRLRARVGR